MLDFILGCLSLIFDASSPLLYIFIGLMVFATFQKIRSAFIA